MTAVGRVVWQEFHRSPLDWYFVGFVLIIGLLLVVIGVWLQRKQLVTTEDRLKEIESKIPSILVNGVPVAGPAATQRLQVVEESAAYQNKLIELGRSIDGILSPLQIEAVQLSAQLLEFLKKIGPPPAPKYTPEEIDKMTTRETRQLIDSNDGDFLEACEYYRPGGIAFTEQQSANQQAAYMTRMLPWYQKLAAAYNLEKLGDKVETIRNRFLVEGITDNDNMLLMPIEGRYGPARIQNISAKLWELAGKMARKGAV
ncbi:MAG: hypothetical protein WBS24_09900 [Terriglobales bacterium]